ncbi:hypothetical protein J6Z19_07435 [bacterium]|nr:hypothetical protein [bacterium]
MELLIKRIVFFLFCAAIFFVCCNKSEKVGKENSPDFYELCFYFSKLPSKTEESDVKAASEIYSAFLKENGVSVFEKKSSLLKSCYFLDKEPIIPNGYLKDAGNGIAGYILKAFFNRENSSLYVIKNSGKMIKKIDDGITLERKIHAAEAIDEGLEISGFEPEIIRFSHYLDNLEIKNSLGLNRENKILLSIPADLHGRWRIALFLYETIDFENIVKPEPGDFAIFTLSGDGTSETNIRKSGWRKENPGKTAAEKEKNAILFKSGAVNLPFSGEVALKYLYSLALAHRLTFENGFAYSPNFQYSSVNPQLYLFSGRLGFSGSVPDAEHLFMWILSSERQLETYPDTLYANLLALKMAKKLVFGDRTFLGGKNLENKNLYIDFETVRNSFFSSENVSVSGEAPENIYLFSGGTTKETAEPADISEISAFRALFGNPEISSYSIVTFAVRSRKTTEIINKIEKSLSEKGFEVIHRIEENLQGGDAWGAVSVRTEIANENKLLSLYEKKYKLMDGTLSFGVYRVSEE